MDVFLFSNCGWKKQILQYFCSVSTNYGYLIWLVLMVFYFPAAVGKNSGCGVAIERSKWPVSLIIVWYDIFFPCSHHAVNACLIPICSLHGMAVTTIEGVGSIRTRLHPVQVGSFCFSLRVGLLVERFAVTPCEYLFWQAWYSSYFSLFSDVFCFLEKSGKMWLKTLDTIGNCQRRVFTVGLSQHMHKITNLWKFELNRSSKLRDINERKKTTLGHTKLCAFRCLISKPQTLNLRSQNPIRWKSLLSRKLHYFRGSCFSNVLYYQQLPITRYQERHICQ